MIYRRLFFTTVVASAITLGPAMRAEATEAAPYWCKSWQVSGQTWYAQQTTGHSLMFTLRASSQPGVFGGYARNSRGDVSQGGTSSQFVRGGVSSSGVGHVLINVVWTNGTSGQYNGTVDKVYRGASGGLVAGLQGFNVQTAGGSGSARWYADGSSSGTGLGTHWPMVCAPANVVRYP